MRLGFSRKFFVSVFIVAVLCCFLSDHALAIGVAPLDEACTSDESFEPDNSQSPGIVTTVVSQLKSKVSSLTQTLFQAISSDGGFRNAVSAAVVLYIAIYGVMFSVGMAYESMYLFSMRVLKISLLALLVNGAAWSMFNQYVVEVANDTVDDLIEIVTSSGPSGGSPEEALDKAITQIFSAKTTIHLFAMATTGMYGPFHAVIAILALISLVGAVLLAIWVYLMSIVMRALLFGLAPIFLACILFDRTKPIFLGWVNQVVSVCLQPIFLFTFLKFFLDTISATMDEVLSAPVCWTEMTDSMRGTVFKILVPKFAIPDSTGGGWVKSSVDWLWDGAFLNDASITPIFPVDILALLTLFMMTQMVGRFSEISVMIAKDIGSGAANLVTMQSGIKSFFEPENTAGAAPQSASGRVGPMGRNGPISEEEAGHASETAHKIQSGLKNAVELVKDAVSKRTGV